MSKHKIWNKTDTLYLANGEPATPDQVIQKWPFARSFPTVLEMNGPLVAAIDALPVLVDVYGIDESLSETEQLAAIAVARERARNPEAEEA